MASGGAPTPRLMLSREDLTVQGFIAEFWPSTFDGLAAGAIYA